MCACVQVSVCAHTCSASVAIFKVGPVGRKHPFRLRQSWPIEAMQRLMRAMGAARREVRALANPRRAKVLPHDGAIPSLGPASHTTAFAWVQEGVPKCSGRRDDERSSERDDDSSMQSRAMAWRSFEVGVGISDDGASGVPADLEDDLSSLGPRMPAIRDFEVAIAGFSLALVHDWSDC